MKTAFVQLMGMEGVNELRVSELGPGETTDPFKFEVDEIVYVLEGRGITTVWSEAGALREPQGPRRSFEWSPRSMFFLPRHYTHQFSNTSGQNKVRLMHYNYLPVALSACDSPDFFFNNKYMSAPPPTETQFSEAKAYTNPEGRGRRQVWYGNFFPDMQAWDKLEPFWGRGAGSHVVGISFPDSAASCHMSVFPPGTYKKGHRHGPGAHVIILEGQGYSLMWRNQHESFEDIRWKPGTMLVPPGMWWHQHFNAGPTPARYLAIRWGSTKWKVTRYLDHQGIDKSAKAGGNQIEYADQDPRIHRMFVERCRDNGVEVQMDEFFQESLSP
jgi:oxalate decarboxylase/phosphoglucose isomerase-like protein (cupin superfamily)